jgi:hypothetical protein
VDEKRGEVAPAVEDLADRGHAPRIPGVAELPCRFRHPAHNAREELLVAELATDHQVGSTRGDKDNPLQVDYVFASDGLIANPYVYGTLDYEEWAEYSDRAPTIDLRGGLARE